MFKFEFRDSRGRKVSQREWLKRLERDVRVAAEADLDTLVRRVRCPEHGQHARNLRRSRMGSRVEWRWDACCDSLTAAIQRELAH